MKKLKHPTKAEKLMEKLVGGTYSQLATYSDLFTKTSDAIFLLDPDTNKVLECNPASTQILGVSNEEIQGSDFLQWVARDSQAIVESNLFKPAKSFDSNFCQASGQFIVLEVSACRLKLGDYCEVTQVIGKDVTLARKAACELLEANQRLANLSNTDEMTKLFNFRYLKSELQKEHERAIRYSRSYSIILCDIDHFKNFNDKNGHPEGDEALKQVARLLKERSRNTDIVARYGGEEFLVLCPEVDENQCQILAESLRESIEKSEFRYGEKQPLGRVTISIGVASFPRHGTSPEEVMKAADLGLYTSKAQGRNRVSLFTPNIKKAA